YRTRLWRLWETFTIRGPRIVEGWKARPDVRDHGEDWEVSGPWGGKIKIAGGTAFRHWGASAPAGAQRSTTHPAAPPGGLRQSQRRPTGRTRQRNAGKYRPVAVRHDRAVQGMALRTAARPSPESRVIHSQRSRPQRQRRRYEGHLLHPYSAPPAGHGCGV